MLYCIVTFSSLSSWITQRSNSYRHVGFKIVEHLIARGFSKMNFSHWKPPGVPVRMWSANLDASILGVSDPRRAFLLAFRVTAIPDDWYKSTMGVIVRGLGTPRSTGENFGCTWEHLGAPATSLGVPSRSLGAPGSAGEMPGSAGDKSGSAGDKTGSADDKSRIDGDQSGSTSTHSRAVWVKHLLWERCWCAWKSYLLLTIQRLLTLMYSVCILIYVSILLPIYTWYIWTGCRWCVRAIRGAPEHDDQVNSEIHSEAAIKQVWRWTWRR